MDSVKIRLIHAGKGTQQWQIIRQPPSSLYDVTTSGSQPQLAPEDLLPLLDTSTVPLLLDVREEEEFSSWHINGALNIPLDQLADRLGEIARGRELVLICAVGLRAERGANFLSSVGYRVRVLTGGMQSWGRTYEVVESDLGGVIVCQVRRRGKGCLSYVVGAGDRAVVIDPSTELDQYQSIAAAHGFTISHVLDTHLHADHLSGARALATKMGATLLLNPADPFEYDFTPIVNDLRIELSASMHLTVSAVSAPGHTEGSTVYQLGSIALFTGDTLFLESVGRPDLADFAEPFARSLYRSLHNVVLPLDDDMMIFPAHYGESVHVRFGELVTKRLGELRLSLPALAYDEEDFVHWAISHVTDRPPNYVEIVRFNAGRPRLEFNELRQLELGPNRCAIAS